MRSPGQRPAPATCKIQFPISCHFPRKPRAAGAPAPAPRPPPRTPATHSITPSLRTRILTPAVINAKSFQLFPSFEDTQFIADYGVSRVWAVRQFNIVPVIHLSQFHSARNQATAGAHFFEYNPVRYLARALNRKTRRPRHDEDLNVVIVFMIFCIRL